MTKQWTGKTKGGVFGYKFFIFLIKYTNIRVVYFFLKIVAVYFLLFSNKKSIIFYFKKIHHKKNLSLIYCIYKNYIILGEILIDKIVFMLKKTSKYTFNYEGENHLIDLAKSGKSAMLIGAHMGNWEIAGNLLKRIDTKINIVLLDAEEERIKTLFHNYGIQRNFNIISIKNDFSHLIQIKEAFINNEFVVMHGDRFIDETSTTTVDFMGFKAKFPNGPLYMASKYKVPVSFVYTMKEKLFHYHFFATKPIIFNYPSNLKTRKEDISFMVKSFTSSLELMVKKYPIQWFNYFPFWEIEKK